ncbi:MAG: hypothetical protein CM1200mP16_04850 [Nitrospina sp.]|nr:MAG: hypothetical protein CM1200mP16_04850 [Nitrospina sp.]
MKSKNAPNSVRDLKLALASCHLVDPNSLKIRKNLIRKKRVPLNVLLKQRSCALMAKRSFEKDLAYGQCEIFTFFEVKDKLISNLWILFP